ncbi:MAG: hypothetical protein HFF69_08670 [Oscillospiraceae bacterium]|nr:hypothetical protein [Oscillospiraceae bacterium]
MRRQRFGASSERTQALLDPVEQVTYKRRKQEGKREMDCSGLPVEQIAHELLEAEQVCAECGEPLHICGHQVLRRELAYVPVQYKVVEHVQTVYSCRYQPVRKFCVKGDKV